VGIDVHDGTAVVKPGGTVSLSVSAALTSTTATLSLGILTASIGTSLITFNGSATLTLTDPTPGDDGITAGDLTNASVFSPTLTGTIPSPIKIHASIGSGVDILGSGSLVGATLGICFTGTCDDAALSGASTPVALFGDGAGPLSVNVTVKPDNTGVTDLFNSIANGTSFSNIGPNGIISMLSQVASFFTSIAGQSFLSTQIPFTSITLGDALDFAKGFTHQYLDPLFKSGDATKPDANGDGKVDFNDFNFSSIQDLLNRLTVALGLGSPLKATWDSANNILTFPF